jgi:superfamily II DNA or RNA helicase
MLALGGAVLADEVGLGKSYVALAVLLRGGGGVVVCPRVLVSQWRVLVRAYGLEAVVEVRSFGEREEVESEGGVLVVDEAHHLRNVRTQRWARVARMARGRRVLCLTGTPIHNAVADIGGLLGLFVSKGVTRAVAGAAEWGGGNEGRLMGLVRALVLRRERSTVRMERRLVRWRVVEEEAAEWVVELAGELQGVVDDLGLGRGVLAMWGRRWSSSLAGLERSLRRARKRAAIVEEGLRNGWEFGGVEMRRSLRVFEVGEEDWFQPELMFDEGEVRGDVEHWRELQERLSQVLAGGWRRREEEWLGWALEECEKDGVVLVFSRYVHSARAFWRLLCERGEVEESVLLTGAGCWHSDWGRSGVEEGVRLAQSWTRSMGRRVVVMTPLGTEGLNFPEVDRVVHLDLPDTWARMEQRVGRADRLLVEGELEVVVRRLPERVEALCGVEERVERKRVSTTEWQNEVMERGAAGMVDGVWVDELQDGGVDLCLERRRGGVRAWCVSEVPLRYGVMDVGSETLPVRVDGSEALQWSVQAVVEEDVLNGLRVVASLLVGGACVDRRVRVAADRFGVYAGVDLMELSMRGSEADFVGLEGLVDAAEWRAWCEVVMGRFGVVEQLSRVVDRQGG